MHYELNKNQIKFLSMEDYVRVALDTDEQALYVTSKNNTDTIIELGDEHYNKILKSLQKYEALQRMETLKLHKNVIREFKEQNILNYSERQNAVFDGILYHLHNDKHYVELVRRFELNHNALVYHAQLCRTEFGLCLTLLYVSREIEEWELERSDLESDNNGVMNVCARVENLTDPYLSETGFVGLVRKNGGVSRVY